MASSGARPPQDRDVEPRVLLENPDQLILSVEVHDLQVIVSVPPAGAGRDRLDHVFTDDVAQQLRDELVLLSTRLCRLGPSDNDLDLDWPDWLGDDPTEHQDRSRAKYDTGRRHLDAAGADAVRYNRGDTDD